MLDRARILGSFIRTRWLRRFRSREQLLRWQKKRVDAFVRRLVEECPFYASCAPQLASLPIINKQICLEHFQELNRHGISLEQATGHALEAEAERDFSSVLGNNITVGLSSGTSGQRGVFLVGRGERLSWAGIALARALSTASLKRILNPFAARLKIAFFLRANSNLYTTLASRRIEFRYFDLMDDMSGHIEALGKFRPDILVAPATVLAELANAPGLRIAPMQIISVAEVLDSRDAALIEERFQLRPSQIYQATEGCLGYTCERGRIHLNEEFLHIECEWLDETKTRFHPVITDFSRTTQFFARYRLDDILRTGEQECPCGRHSMVIDSIEGRSDEVLWMPTAVFPETIRQALYSVPSAVDAYRVEQHGGALHIHLKKSSAKLESEIATAMNTLFDNLRLDTPDIRFQPWSEQAAGEKQRRIRCIARPRSSP